MLRWLCILLAILCVHASLVPFHYRIEEKLLKEWRKLWKSLVFGEDYDEAIVKLTKLKEEADKNPASLEKFQIIPAIFRTRKKPENYVFLIKMFTETVIAFLKVMKSVNDHRPLDDAKKLELVKLVGDVKNAADKVDMNKFYDQLSELWFMSQANIGPLQEILTSKPMFQSKQYYYEQFRDKSPATFCLYSIMQGNLRLKNFIDPYSYRDEMAEVRCILGKDPGYIRYYFLLENPLMQLFELMKTPSLNEEAIIDYARLLRALKKYPAYNNYQLAENYENLMEEVKESDRLKAMLEIQYRIVLCDTFCKFAEFIPFQMENVLFFNSISTRDASSVGYLFAIIMPSYLQSFYDQAMLYDNIKQFRRMTHFQGNEDTYLNLLEQTGSRYTRGLLAGLKNKTEFGMSFLYLNEQHSMQLYERTGMSTAATDLAHKVFTPQIMLFANYALLSSNHGYLGAIARTHLTDWISGEFNTAPLEVKKELVKRYPFEFLTWILYKDVDFQKVIN